MDKHLYDMIEYQIWNNPVVSQTTNTPLVIDEEYFVWGHKLGTFV